MDYYRNAEDLCEPSKNRPLYNAVIETVFTAEGSTEPVTIAEVKRQLQLAQDFTDDDVYLNEQITECREDMERALGVSMITRTVVAIIKNEMGKLELPYGPVAEILDVNSADAGLDVGEYEILGEGTEIGPLFMHVVSPKLELMTVKYKAGYSTIPHGLKRALLRFIADSYEHRGDNQEVMIPKGAYKYKRGSWLL